MKKRDQKKIVILISLMATMLLTSLLMSCVSVSDDKIAQDIESSIMESDIKDVSVDVTEQGGLP